MDEINKGKVVGLGKLKVFIPQAPALRMHGTFFQTTDLRVKGMVRMYKTNGCIHMYRLS